MNSGLLERLVVALESIATSLANGPAPATDSPAPEKAEDKPKPGRKRSTKEEPTKAEPPKPDPVKAEESESKFDYDVLKRAIIELASFGDEGRAAVLEIFGRHKVKDNKASNAPEALWPKLHAEATEALTKLQMGDGEGEGDFA